MLQEVYYSHFIIHCVKRVRIRSYSGLHFRIWSISSYSVRIRKNADQNNSEYGHFSRSDNFFLSCHSCVTEACKVYGAASFMSNDFNSYVTNPSIWNSNTVSRSTNLFTSLCQWSTLDLECLNPFDWDLYQMKDTLKLIKTDLEPV